MLFYALLFYFISLKYNLSPHAHTLNVCFVCFVYLQTCLQVFHIKNAFFYSGRKLGRLSSTISFCKQTQNREKIHLERIPMECFDVSINFLFEMAWWISRMEYIHRSRHLLDELQMKV